MPRCRVGASNPPTPAHRTGVTSFAPHAFRESPSWPFEDRRIGQIPVMLFDILVAVIIVVIAAILGIVVHPVLWVIVIAAALWLFGRSRARGSGARI